VAKRIAILGSTGSIGAATVDVVEHLSRSLGEPYQVVALAAASQVQKLAEQTRRTGASLVCVADPARADELARGIHPHNARVLAGPQGLIDITTHPEVDIVVAAIVGAAGLPAVLAAVRAGKTVALANKESLVVAGSLVISEAKAHGATILPIDSEHSAVFQAMLAGRRADIRRVILTASGGPFRTASPDRIERATLADALAHPTWRMGSKVTIDSATMFNKALEIIEACWLFDIEPRRIDVVIHPESIIHSMVEYVDGSVLAQASPPDMRMPIQYALTYPRRHPGLSPRLDLTRKLALNFEPPDPQRFPALRLAYQTAERRGAAGAVLNAANEVAVNAFISGRITFGMICRCVEDTIHAQHSTAGSSATPGFDGLMQADAQARRNADEWIARAGKPGPDSAPRPAAPVAQIAPMAPVAFQR
jgi:1-deoxy-D-xylulose-5-phosphate reductoisomerase